MTYHKTWTTEWEHSTLMYWIKGFGFRFLKGYHLQQKNHLKDPRCVESGQ